MYPVFVFTTIVVLRVRRNDTSHRGVKLSRDPVAFICFIENARPVLCEVSRGGRCLWVVLRLR